MPSPEILPLLRLLKRLVIMLTPLPKRLPSVEPIPCKVSPREPRTFLDSATVSFKSLTTLLAVSLTCSTVCSPVKPLTASWRKSPVPSTPSLTVFPTAVPRLSSGWSSIRHPAKEATPVTAVVLGFRAAADSTLPPVPNTVLPPRQIVEVALLPARHTLGTILVANDSHPIIVPFFIFLV